MNLFNFFMILGCMFVLDRSLPWIMMSYGVHIFPWADEDKRKALVEYYGWFKFPRAAFIILLAILALLPIDSDIQLALGVGFVIAWCIFAFRDLWKGRSAAPSHRVDGDDTD